MKTLVVYYSRSGTTGKVAKLIAEQCHADIEEIKDTAFRKGWIGYFFAGRDGMKKSLTKIVPPTIDPSTYDLVIVGTPKWVNLTPAIRTYLTQYGKKLKRCAFFCTMGGEDGSLMLAEMESLVGKKPVGTLELSSVDMEGKYTEKVTKFVSKLLKLTL